jgi:hypothetical protein
MEILSYLSDVIGPRLTGSPGLKRANEWTKEKMTSFGLQNAHLEPWGPFGRGWALKKFNAQVTEPLAIPLIAYPKAWSGGTNGPVTGEVVWVNASNDTELEAYKGKLKGAIVLVSGLREVKAWFDPAGARQTEKQLLALADAGEPRAPQGGGNRGGFNQTPEQRAAAQFNTKKTQFIYDEQPAVIVDAGRGDGGTIFVQSANMPQQPANTPQAERVTVRTNGAKVFPQVTISAEHYNRVLRMIQAGEKVKMTIDVAVEYYETDPMAYNTIAEIPGSDLKDEIVMVGAHMDSWHAGTGATDNGAGCAVAMEAVRILQALGLKPRRTIRVGLWSGEEQGLLGSRAYVAEHFGKMEAPPPAPGATPPPPTPGGGGFGNAPGSKLVTKPDWDKFSSYFNLDNGTGKIRGVYLQGNEAVRSIFREWLMPFRDMGASTLSLSNTGGTDHQSFDGIGLPGFQFIQDQIEYDTRTHHSNQDVFDRIQADDMKEAATIMAAFLYQAATRAEKLPRKPAPGR